MICRSLGQELRLLWNGEITHYIMTYSCVHFEADLKICEIRLIFKISFLLRTSICFVWKPDTFSQAIGHRFILKLNACYFVQIRFDFRVISFSRTLHEASIYGSGIRAYTFLSKWLQDVKNNRNPIWFGDKMGWSHGMCFKSVFTEIIRAF